MRPVLKQLKLTKEVLKDMYEKLIPSSKKVLKLFHFPKEMDELQLEVSKHLKRYTRDLDPEKLKSFLRFCTGSNLLTTEKKSQLNSQL